MDINEAVDIVYGWFSDTVGKVSYTKEKCIKIINETEANLYLYTFTNKYTINIVPINEKYKKGYIGGFLSCRKNRPGPDNITPGGTDLPDGPFSYEVFQNIIYAIIKCELEDIYVPKYIKDATIEIKESNQYEYYIDNKKYFSKDRYINLSTIFDNIFDYNKLHKRVYDIKYIYKSGPIKNSDEHTILYSDIDKEKQDLTKKNIDLNKYKYFCIVYNSYTLL